MKPDDIIDKVVAIALMFGLAAWLLHQLRRGYEAQFAERDRFVAAVSHELRSPLTALTGFTEALLSRIVEPGSPEAMEIVDLMAAQAPEAADIVEDLLVASRADAGQVVTDDLRTELATETNAVVDALHVDETMGKTVMVEDDSVAVTADPLRLRQIIRNLLTNAARHGGDRIVVRTRVRQGYGVVEVADNGTDFDPAETATMFAPYGRATRADLSTGSIGLGLTVSRQLTTLMGGSLEASCEDEMTTFRLSLPLAEAPARTSF